MSDIAEILLGYNRRQAGQESRAGGHPPGAHLVYRGLRRESRRANARRQLRTAHEMFSAMSVDAFARRAKRKPLATGETARKRDAGTIAKLTPQSCRPPSSPPQGYLTPGLPRSFS
jgi:hypothetical protein